jgi:hypothetical protein
MLSFAIYFYYDAELEIQREAANMAASRDHPASSALLAFTLLDIRLNQIKRGERNDHRCYSAAKWQ